MRVLVTGGSGFIGSAVVRFLIGETDAEVVNVDKLTYAASPEAVASVEHDARYRFERVDICDAPRLRGVFEAHDPDLVMHLAAESHVDRSIDAPGDFIQTNVVGTYTLLQESLRHFQTLPEARRRVFRYHQVSTDEVYGSLDFVAPPFTEETPCRPNSPYAASKASADHLARAWHHTFGLPVVASNCSNNYGPYQFPEKLVPLIITKALLGEELPVYGDGGNVRDWLHVEDHARALWLILTKGVVGETYNVGGDGERTNIDVVQMLCDLIDRLEPSSEARRKSIRFVPDRPGHDRRYAIDSSKLRQQLGFVPRESFESGLENTARWYIANRDWWQEIFRKRYQRERLGIVDRNVSREAP